MAPVKARVRARRAKGAALHATKIADHVPDAVPPLLSFVAGYVDSCTFLALFGLFVAQATGSFVVAGAQLAGHEHGIVKILAIPIFLLGATITTMIGIQLRAQGKAALAWCLTLEAVLLAGLLAAGIGAPFADPDAGWSLVASFLALSAMGVQSALVRLLMRGVASTNVMTTNMTLIGIDFAEFLLAWHAKRRASNQRLAAQRYRTVRRRFSIMLFIALGFLLGAALGALAFNLIGWLSLAAPIVLIVALAGWAFVGKR